MAILIAYGYSNIEVADRLTISVRTAESHRQHLMQKLGATSRADVVRWALEKNLLRV